MRSKISLATTLAIGLIAATSAGGCTPGNYEWVNLARSGRGCFPPNCVEGQFPMAVMPVRAFDRKLWSVGQKAAWSSPDGLTWRSEPKTDWGERHGMDFVFFRDKLWMSGGMSTWADFRNDVWSSRDGREWTQVSRSTAWPARRGHKVVVFNDRLWLLGGSLSSGRVDRTPVRWLNDIWTSDDGVRWTLVTGNAPWSPRSDHAAFVFDNKLWIVGGWQKDDVWSSADGKNWNLVTDRAPWGVRHGNGSLVFDGRIWVFGGVDRNDVWSSRDGKSWEVVTSSAPWSMRSAVYSVVFNDGIWIFSGKTGRDDSWAGDIWLMRRASARGD